MIACAAITATSFVPSNFSRYGFPDVPSPCQPLVAVPLKFVSVALVVGAIRSTHGDVAPGTGYGPEPFAFAASSDVTRTGVGSAGVGRYSARSALNRASACASDIAPV